VGSWYRVTKKINGRLYDYWQRTYRIGKSVKTENKYIGPTAAIGLSSGGTTYKHILGAHVVGAHELYVKPLDAQERAIFDELGGRFADYKNAGYVIQGNRQYEYARRIQEYREAKRKTEDIKALESLDGDSAV
jgi:hypothetical protein